MYIGFRSNKLAKFICYFSLSVDFLEFSIYVLMPAASNNVLSFFPFFIVLNSSSTGL